MGGKVYRLTETELAKACRKAYRLGQRKAEAKFDALLERLHRLKELNGTTALFKAEWDESKHPRDGGKFAAKGAGDGAGAAGGGGAGAAPRGAGAAGSGGARGDRAPSVPAPDADYLLDGLHAHVPAGQWAAVRDAVLSVAQKVHERLVLATPALLKVQHILTTIGDHPDDLKTLGYKPVTSGVAGHDTPDAFRDATGISGTIGARLAAHVLAKAVSWVKTHTGAGKAVDENTDPYAEAGEALADVLAMLADAFGLDGELPDGAAVADALRAANPKFSCAMVNLKGPVVDQLNHMQAQIRDEDLSEDARETDYHVTVRYGLHTDDAEEVRPIVERFGPIKMTFGKPDFFAGADSGKDYDVIILPVESDGLKKLNADLADLPHTDTHADYKPHATVAYVKAGKAKGIVAKMGYPRTTLRETVHSVVFSNRDKEKTTIPLDGGDNHDGDPHASALIAMLDHAIEAAESGGDVQAGLDRIVDAMDDGEPGDEDAVEKAFDSDKHPRDDHGRFVSKDAIQAAQGDPAKAEELRKRVTNPEQRKKLDAAISGEVDVGRTKRGEAKHQTAQRRKTRQASKDRAREILHRVGSFGDVTADDVRDLADHLPAMTLAELRLHREALMAKLGGKRVKQGYVDALLNHARGSVPQLSQAERMDAELTPDEQRAAALDARMSQTTPDATEGQGDYPQRELTQEELATGDESFRFPQGGGLARYKEGQPAGVTRVGQAGWTDAAPPDSEQVAQGKEGADKPATDIDAVDGGQQTVAMNTQQPDKPVLWRHATNGLTRGQHRAAVNLDFKLAAATSAKDIARITQQAFASDPEMAARVAQYHQAAADPDSLARAIDAKRQAKVGKKTAPQTRKMLDDRFSEMQQAVDRPHLPHKVNVTVRDRDQFGRPVDSVSYGGAFATRQEAEDALKQFPHGRTKDGTEIVATSIEERQPTAVKQWRAGDPIVPDHLKEHVRENDLYHARRYLATVASKAPRELDAERQRVGEHLAKVAEQRSQADTLPGGRADRVPDAAVPAAALAQGQAHEREHTSDPAAAKEIAKDHLAEDPAYYDKLKQVGDGAGAGKQRDLNRKPVEYVRAAAGGQVSEVDGKFYRGGQLMPVHGKYSGIKKPPKGNGVGTSDPVQAKEDSEGGGGGRSRGDGLTPEERRAQAEARSKWDEMNRGPMGRLTWLGDSPNRKATENPQLVLDKWREFASEIGPDGVRHIISQLEPQLHATIDSQIATSRANGHSIESDAEQWYKDDVKRRAEEYMGYGRSGKKHERELPGSHYAHQLIGEMLRKDNAPGDRVDVMHKMNQLLIDAANAKNNKPQQVEDGKPTPAASASSLRARVEANNADPQANTLPGGRADGVPDAAVPAAALAQGQAHEREHTRDAQVAKEIAKDHLAEDLAYYDKLKQVEGGKKDKKPRDPNKPRKAPAATTPRTQTQYGQAGESHPLAGLPDSAKRNKIGQMIHQATQASGDGHDVGQLGDISQRPAFLTPDLEDDIRGVVARHHQAVTVGPYLHDLYQAVGKKHGLSKHDFQRAVAHLHDQGTVRLSAWGKTTDELPDPELATILPDSSGSPMYAISPPNSAYLEQPDAALGDQSLNTSHPLVAAKYPNATRPAPATPAASASSLRARVEANNADPQAKPITPQEADGIVADLRAKHSDDELKQVAKQFTGRSGTNAQQALKLIHDDLVAVHRALESQKV